MELAFIALGAAGLGLLASSTAGLLSLYWWLKDRRELAAEHEAALIEHSLHEALLELQFPDPPAPNYRHNIHCPGCGRFAKRVLGMDNVVECKHHGVQVRWNDLPIDWISTPVSGVKVYVDPHPVTAPIALIPITAPIDLPVLDEWFIDDSHRVAHDEIALSASLSALESANTR